MVRQITFKLVWDRKALDHLKDILAYLSKQSDQAPSIVKTAILDRIEVIRKSPLACESDKLKDPSDKDFRAFVVFSYRVTYQIDSKKREIRILRVRHTSREPLGY
jgi:plasmid stabilization system protein ParE